MTIPEPIIASIHADLLEFARVRCQNADCFCDNLPTGYVQLGDNLMMVVSMLVSTRWTEHARIEFVNDDCEDVFDVPPGLVVLKIVASAAGQQEIPLTPRVYADDRAFFALCPGLDYRVVFEGRTVLELKAYRAWAMYHAAV